MGKGVAPIIFTVGAAVWDVFLRSPAFYVINDEHSVTGAAQCVALGTKIESDLLFTSSGGGASNAAVTFARLGFPTSIVGRVGGDDHGEAIIAQLETEKIDTDHMVVDADGQTGYSVILMVENGERSIVTFRGVSKTWSPTNIPNELKTADGVYITTLAGDIPTLKTAIDLAASNGAKIFLNPGMAEMKQTKELLPLLPKIDTLLVNLEESRTLLGTDGDAAATAHALHAHVPRVIVTDGPRGATLVSDDDALVALPSGVINVSRTGAGDAFGSGFAAAIMKGLSAENALKVGTANAEGVISHVGAKVGILKNWPSDDALKRIRIQQL